MILDYELVLLGLKIVCILAEYKGITQKRGNTKQKKLFRCFGLTFRRKKSESITQKNFKKHRNFGTFM